MKIQIVTNIARTRQDISRSHVGQWPWMVDGGFMRGVYLPPGKLACLVNTSREAAGQLIDVGVKKHSYMDA
jgi:hypothetical protein